MLPFDKSVHLLCAIIDEGGNSTSQPHAPYGKPTRRWRFRSMIGLIWACLEMKETHALFNTDIYTDYPSL